MTTYYRVTLQKKHALSQSQPTEQDVYVLVLPRYQSFDFDTNTRFSSAILYNIMILDTKTIPRQKKKAY